MENLTQSFKTGNLGQLPDFGKWRMFDVTSNDPLERGLKRVDRFLQWFRDTGNQTLNHFYLEGTAQRFIKAKSREVEKYLDTIEKKAYNLAKGFERRYDAKTTSPSGEQYLLEQVYEFIRGDLKLNKLPTEMQKPSQELKKTFDEIKQRFVNELPEGGGMRNAIQANLDKYMRMSFATFRNSGYKASPDVVEKATDFMVNRIKANENLLEQAVKGSNLPTEEAVRNFARQNVDNILSMGKTEGRDPIEILQRINNKIILDDDVVIKTGEELPDVIRKLLGEEINLRSSVMTTTGSLVTQTANLKAWRQATKRGLDDGYLFESFEEATRAGIKDAQQIGRVPGLGLLETEATAAKGGPLGLFASKEVAKTFAGTGGMLDNLLQNSVYQSIIAYKAGVQTGKTVFSPATQTRNFGSAAAFPLFSGHIGGQASVRDAFKITLDDIFGAGKVLNEEDLIKRTARKIELGVLDEGIVASELNAILKDLKGGKIKTLGKFAEAVDNAKFYKTATRVYQGGDNVWKWYGHEFYMSQLKNAFKNLDDVVDYMKTTHNIDLDRSNFMTGTTKTLSEGVEEAAAYLLRETYPTYSKVPEVVQALRKLPLGNFVSFTSEILRTGFATSSVALKHISSNNPVLREMGYRSLMGQAITLGALNEGVKGLGHALTNVSPTQVEAFKEFFGPEYMQYSTLIPTTDMKDGVFKVFDWSRYQPYDILSATANELLKSIEIKNLDPKIAELNKQLNDIQNPFL